MTLTTREEIELKKLLAKDEENEPIADEELAEIEQRVADVYESCPDLFKGAIESWNQFCKTLKAISDDNNRLIREVRRLKKQASKGPKK